MYGHVCTSFEGMCHSETKNSQVWILKFLRCAECVQVKRHFWQFGYQRTYELTPRILLIFTAWFELVQWVVAQSLLYLEAGPHWESTSMSCVSAAFSNVKPFFIAMLCKTQHAYIIWHAFSRAWSNLLHCYELCCVKVNESGFQNHNKELYGSLSTYVTSVTWATLCVMNQ